jgi:hypothetical protein
VVAKPLYGACGGTPISIVLQYIEQQKTPDSERTAEAVPRS